MAAVKHELGQYFTTDQSLKSKVLEFIRNGPGLILEPSVGRGDLVEYVCDNMSVEFDMYEIDTTISFLDCIDTDRVISGDFIAADVSRRYTTIVGNPPYVKQKNGNLYIQFISKCVKLLEEDGELIFIIPSDFFKLTSSAKVLTTMLDQGVFTHIYHPNDEDLFIGAKIDVIIFRYQKTKSSEQICLYNDERLRRSYELSRDTKVPR